MPTFVAFLRAINVTGRFIRMSDLAAAFHQLGHLDARTHINSGNVVFSSARRSAAKLERTLEEQLETHLGFRAESFVRTATEVRAIAARAHDLRQRVSTGGEVNVCFLQAPLGASQVEEVRTMKSELDDFEIAPREVYWLCLYRPSDSRFSNAVLERRLKLRSTLRRSSMLRGLAAEL